MIEEADEAPLVDLVLEVGETLQEFVLDNSVFPAHQSLLQALSHGHIDTVCDLDERFVDQLLLFRLIFTDEIDYLADLDVFLRVETSTCLVKVDHLLLVHGAALSVESLGELGRLDNHLVDVGHQGLLNLAAQRLLHVDQDRVLARALVVCRRLVDAASVRYLRWLHFEGVVSCASGKAGLNHLLLGALRPRLQASAAGR